MTDQAPDRERGAQEVTPGQREAEHAPADQQDFEKPAEGRDTPPDEGGRRKRDPNSPWMGGG